MQPLSEVTLVRPWHWGIAILGDPLAEVPVDLDGHALVVGRDAVTVGVRHAQDTEVGDVGGDGVEVDGVEVDGDEHWATATVRVRSLARAEATERHVLCDIVLATPSRSVSLGDADEMLVIPAPGTRTRLIVSVDEVDPSGLETVWVDLVAVAG